MRKAVLKKGSFSTIWRQERIIMLKSILAVFGGAFGMILKVLLAIMLVIVTVYCLITVFTEKFIWGGLMRVAAATGSVLLFKFLIRPPKDE